jgi:hypothetical protein
MRPRLRREPTPMMTEAEGLRHKIRGLYPKRQIGDLTEKAFQRELVERTVELYRALIKDRLAKGETIQKEHHVAQSHFRLTQSVLREPEQTAVSLFSTDRRLFRIRSAFLPSRPPTADEKDQTVIEELPLKKIRALSLRRQIRWGEAGVGGAMGAFALLFASWLSFTGPFLIGLGAAGIFHGLLLPTRWMEIIPEEGYPSTDPFLIYALRKRSARDLVQFLQVRKGNR